MKLLPLLLALSLCACAGVHESEWNYADGIQRSHGHHNPRPAVPGKRKTTENNQ